MQENLYYAIIHIYNTRIYFWRTSLHYYIPLSFNTRILGSPHNCCFLHKRDLFFICAYIFGRQSLYNKRNGYTYGESQYYIEKLIVLS